MSKSISSTTKRTKGHDSKLPLSLWFSFILILIAFGLVAQHTFDNVSQLKIYSDAGSSISNLKSAVQSIGYQVTRGLEGDTGALNGVAASRASANQDMANLEAAGIDVTKIKTDFQLIDTIITPVLNQKDDLLERSRAATVLSNALSALKSGNYPNWNSIAFTAGLDKPQTIAGFHNIELQLALRNWKGINADIDKQLDVMKRTQDTLDNLSSISTTLAPFGEPNAMSKVMNDIQSMSAQLTNFSSKKTENLIYLLIIFMTLLFASIFFLRSVLFSFSETQRIRKESKNLRVIGANASVLVAKMGGIIDEQGVILAPNLQYERLSLSGAIYTIGSTIQRLLSSASRMVRSTEESTNQTMDAIASGVQNGTRIQTSLNVMEQHSSIVQTAIERSREAEQSDNQTLKDITKNAATGVKIINELHELLNRTLSQIDGVRDSSQGISKRIKRFAETSHAMSDNTASHRDIARQIKVLAMNAAVQSASAGNSGQRLMIIAAEIQRLSLQSVQHSERMDTLVSSLRDEVQSSINEMETGIQLLVDTSNLAIKAYDQSKAVMNNIEQASKYTDIMKDNDVIIQEATSTGLISMKRISSEQEATVETLKLLFGNMESLRDISKQLLRLISERFPSHG